ncbi:MAG: hypothetical protein ACP5FH_02740 [Terracidiphilus sp.]
MPCATENGIRRLHSQWATTRAPVAHVFDVFFNGTVLLRNFGRSAEARRTDAVTRSYTAPEASAQGNLRLDFAPVEATRP